MSETKGKNILRTNGIIIGTAGIPHSTPPVPKNRLTSEGIKQIKRLGLSAMELEFVQGIYLNEVSAKVVGAVARREGVVLTAHAPYWINLANPEKAEKSAERIIKTAFICHRAGAKSVAFHPAYYRDSEKETFRRVKKELEKILTTTRKMGISVDIRPETAGKTFQFGTLEELVELCKEVEGLKICVDFAHIYSRSLGKTNGYDGFCRVLEYIARELGEEHLHDFHAHIEGIEFGEKGEIRHKNFDESEFDFDGLAKAIVSFKVKGIFICESPSLESDALLFAKKVEKYLNEF